MIPLIVYGPQGSGKTFALNVLFPHEPIHEWDGQSMLPRRVRLIETNCDFHELNTRVTGGCEIISVDQLFKRLSASHKKQKTAPSKFALRLAEMKRK